MNYRQALSIVYPLRDPVEADLNRYLDKQDRDDQRQQAIEDRADELLAGDYSPFLPENVGEAMGEMSKENLSQLAMILPYGAHSLAGAYLRELIIEYWEKMAREKAESEYGHE
jgi:hypothetical protein